MLRQFHRNRRAIMSKIKTDDGTEIFFKDWGTGQPIVFHHWWPLSAEYRQNLAANRAQFYRAVAAGPFYGFNRPGATVSDGLIDAWWRQGMMGDIKAQYDCIAAFSETDFTEDLKRIEIPVLLLHGEDDQVVPVNDAAPRAAELLKKATLKIYPGGDRFLLVYQ
jgi:non-heme chloroperoxidase